LAQVRRIAARKRGSFNHAAGFIQYNAAVAEPPNHRGTTLKLTAVARLAEALGESPQLFPHALDLRNDSVAFVELSRADYARASFLDARILGAGTPRQTHPWGEVTAAIEAAGLAERCNFIFHIGHVGSTLLSRLMGAHARVFALREPMVLRTLAQLQSDAASAPQPWSAVEFDARLGGCLKLLSRTFGPQQCALIKATSFVGELAAALLMRASAPRAILMYVAPETYLATILGGANSREEARLLTPQRLRRLRRRVGHGAWSDAPLTEGEALALGWACETVALTHAARAAGARAMPLDFEKFLAAPAASLREVLRHVGIEASAGEIESIIGGPDMQRYSKAPEHAYDAALRCAVLEEARALYAAEIRRGLAWLERAATQFSAVRDALSFTQAASR
jgi:hypothetical protein